MAKHYIRAMHPSGIVIQPRDIDVFCRLIRNRQMCGNDIALLAQGSTEGYRKRIRPLYDHGYLDKVPAPERDFTTPGTPSHLYRIGQRGTRFLRDNRDRFAISPHLIRQIPWARTPIKAHHAKHRMALVDTMTHIEAACQASKETMQFIPHEEIIDTIVPEATRTASNPFSWRVSLYDRRLERMRPCTLTIDELFGVSRSTNPQSAPSFYILEEDRGSIEVYRDTLDQSSMYRKFLSYAAIEAANDYRRWLGFPKPRILTVTTTMKRVHAMLAMIHEHVVHRPDFKPGRYLFLAKEHLAPGESHLTAPWLNARGESTTLTR